MKSSKIIHIPPVGFYPGFDGAGGYSWTEVSHCKRCGRTARYATESIQYCESCGHKEKEVKIAKWVIDKKSWFTSYGHWQFHDELGYRGLSEEECKKEIDRMLEEKIRKENEELKIQVAELKEQISKQLQ